MAALELVAQHLHLVKVTPAVMAVQTQEIIQPAVAVVHQPLVVQEIPQLLQVMVVQVLQLILHGVLPLQRVKMLQELITTLVEPVVVHGTLLRQQAVQAAVVLVLLPELSHQQPAP